MLELTAIWFIKEIVRLLGRVVQIDLVTVFVEMEY
jgi:hypothetical protein